MTEITLMSSDNVRVYPSSKRSDAYDRNARLNSEQNLISIINRLTGLNAFVIDGLEVSKNGATYDISAGSCNIHGYLFNIVDDITGLTVTHSASDDYLCLAITVKDTVVTTDAFELTFAELQGVDLSDEYTGLKLVTIDDTTPTTDINGTTYYLNLATFIDPDWIDDSNKYLKYRTEDILVNNSYFTGNLNDLLEDEYIIDDGEL